MQLRPSATYVRKTEKEIDTSLKKWEDLVLSDNYERFHKAIEHTIQFARKHGLIIYGGQAMNALLPSDAKIYGKKEINDVDVYSHRPRDHARMLAGELDDLLQLDLVHAKFSFMHDHSYSVFSSGQKLADFTYMDKSAIDTLFLRIERNMQPMAPIDYILYSMHTEFSHPLITPDRWAKTFERYIAILNTYPIAHDGKCLETCVEKPEKELEKIVYAMNKHLKSIPQDRRPPIVGFGATVGMSIAISDEGKAFRNTVPACPSVACLEFLSTDPVVDAYAMKEFVSKELGLGDDILVPYRSGLWIPEGDVDDEGEESVKKVVNKKAMDGQPVDEVVLKYKDERIVASFIKVEVCSHFVVSGDVVYGGIDTIMTFLYKRLLFGPDRNKGPSSPTSLTLRCLINLMYDVQFRSAERKKINMVKRFSTSECFGKHVTFRETFQQQRDKICKNRWTYNADTPENREERRLERVKEASKTSSEQTNKKTKKNKKQSSLSSSSL